MRALLPILVLAAATGAQQPNSTAATLRVNAIDGPPWPITGVGIGVGGVTSIELGGFPGAPFRAVAAPTVQSVGVITPFGLLDVDLAASTVVADGFTDPMWTIDPSGTSSLPVGVPASTATGLTVGLQAIVLDPTTPPYARLTAATEGTTVPGLGTTTLSTTPGLVDLTSMAVSFPFYGTTWTELWVNMNGSITFGASTTNTSAIPVQFFIGPPRIAAHWSVYVTAGTVTATGGPALPGTPSGGVTITWSSAITGSPVYTGPTGSVGGAPLTVPATVSVTLANVTGDITITHDPGNGPPTQPSIAGITPGNAAMATTVPQTNLNLMSATPFLNTANDPIWEYFGLLTMGFYTAPTANPYDLAGSTVTFLNLGGGSYLGM